MSTTESYTVKNTSVYDTRGTKLRHVQTCNERDEAVLLANGLNAILALREVSGLEVIAT